LLFAYHQLIPVTAVRVKVRITIVAAVSIKASTEATAIQTTVADTAAIYRHPVAAETTVAHRVAKAVTSAAKTTAMASAMASSAVASTAASCERGCADRRCRYAEREGRSRCNYLFAHFSKLLMFHLICAAVWMRYRQWSAGTRAHKIAPSRRMGKTFIRSSISNRLAIGRRHPTFVRLDWCNCEPITPQAQRSPTQQKPRRYYSRNQKIIRRFE
jgi:hypothetical protein